MKTFNFSLLTILLILIFNACGKEDVELVGAEYKNMSIGCGSEFEIPVLASDWSIESVSDLSGASMIDEQNNPLALNGFGKVEAANKWFALECKEENKFIVHLKENFSEATRTIVICINSNGDRDYVTIEQNRGESYKLVKKEFQEIKELREIYRSDKGCRKQTFTNGSAEPIWQPVGFIFSNVVYTSEFKSDDYGAFDWVAGEELKIALPDIIMDDQAVRWNDICIYQEGVSTRSYRASENKLMILPYQTLYASGKVEYCKRVFNYTFTIQNKTTGTRFEIKGTCTQTSPLRDILIMSDKPE